MMDHHDPTSPDPNKYRFGEPAKFFPVAFIVAVILGLYLIYTIFHCVPLLDDPRSSGRAVAELVAFNITAVLLVICYIRCILEHPGTIPDKELCGDATWEYAPQDGRIGAEGQPQILQETKRSGDRRHCKWCQKYKPDRCHHCRVCRQCILKMDHHCPWIYNCVGFKNHKYFFLLLFYATIACHLIVWSMLESVKDSIDNDSPFFKMFALLFGETLAGFLGILVTGFFAFHIWLMFKAMTTIEFCEKHIKRTGYDSSVYDRGFCGNIRAVLGDNPALWLLPVNPPSGDGLYYVNEDSKLIEKVDPGTRRARRRPGAGTGGAPGSGQSAEDEDDESESDERARAAAQGLLPQSA